jgi:hypothetical protein
MTASAGSRSFWANIVTKNILFSNFSNVSTAQLNDLMPAAAMEDVETGCLLIVDGSMLTKGRVAVFVCLILKWNCQRRFVVSADEMWSAKEGRRCGRVAVCWWLVVVVEQEGKTRANSHLLTGGRSRSVSRGFRRRA